MSLGRATLNDDTIDTIGIIPFGTCSSKSLWKLLSVYFLLLLKAKRAGITCVLLPEENRTDFAELDENIRENIEVHFVSNYEEVFRVVFPDMHLNNS